MKRDFFRASIAKAHDGEGMANPLFPVQQKPLWKKIMLAVLALGLPLTAGGFGILFLQRPQFQISNVTIEGLSLLNEPEFRGVIARDLSERVMLFFTQKHQFFFNADHLATELEETLPIREATVTRQGAELHVAVVEDIVMVLIHSGEHWLLTGLDGKILRELSADEIKSASAPEAVPPFDRVPLIMLDEQIDVSLAESVLLPARLAGLVRLDHNLRARTLTPVLYALSTRKTSWLKVKTKEKPYGILVDLDQDIDAETAMLDAAAASYANADGGLQYIDLRFGNHVYVK